MNYRTVVLHAEEDLGITGTKIIPIRVQDPITSLDFMCRITLAAGIRLDAEPSCISKLEIVDGSEVLLSLSGTEAVALSVLEGHRLINFITGNMVNGTRTLRLRVNFGRFERDPLLAFDPTKYLNPQLKITYNVAVVQAAATKLYLAVIANCFDEKKISPVGFLRMTEYHSYVGVANTYEYVDLPVDLDIRKLYLQTKNFGTAVPTNLHSVKLSEDNDKRIPFNLEAEQWSQKQALEFGSAEQAFFGYTGGWAANPFFHIAGDQEIVMGQPAVGLNPWRSEWQAGCGGGFASADDTALGVGICQGHIPYLVHCYPFGDQMDIDDWYKLAGRVENLRLRIKAGAAGASVTFNTLLQQLMRY